MPMQPPCNAKRLLWYPSKTSHRPPDLETSACNPVALFFVSSMLFTLAHSAPSMLWAVTYLYRDLFVMSVARVVMPQHEVVAGQAAAAALVHHVEERQQDQQREGGARDAVHALQVSLCQRRHVLRRGLPGHAVEHLPRFNVEEAC
ncbi:hypothetical protein B0T26DRAFT_710121 [Lasiosphaeria miniovina]|uniref:Uncharacterized protein n=1 Tax=Lasiosphaeria miniovina TaxID=1954250 RepID=A0AA40AKK5_9PEZI|nr:uncharacterized protein B0T26DRAFT_710121 [Lasiosphaeria miniovina]KAK0717524.1 hypothetical protein B0T26DRAFT_710121 [Lasiosphaeria miniovina]